MILLQVGAHQVPQKEIWQFFQANKCANPNYQNELSTVDGSFLGEAAHIAGEKQGSARFDSAMTDKQRNDIKNLIYLCANCHTTIDADKDGKKYSVKLLTDWKIKHEEKVRQSQSDAFESLDFPELEEATDWLLTQPAAFQDVESNIDQFRLIAIEDKIKKHELSRALQHTIVQACSRQPSVSQFIEERTKEDSSLPEWLKIRILRQYCDYRLKGLSGDDLFTSMCEYVRMVSKKFPVQAAAISILVYFFEKCDIFSD